MMTIYEALAEPMRRRILDLLRERPRLVGELAELLAISQPGVSKHLRVLKEAGDSIKRFLDSGVTELGDHLGPLLWQFAPFKKFDEAAQRFGSPSDASVL